MSGEEKVVATLRISFIEFWALAKKKTVPGFGGSKPVLPKTAQKKEGTHEQGVSLLQNNVRTGLHTSHMTEPRP
jgi:hypothetical protein